MWIMYCASVRSRVVASFTVESLVKRWAFTSPLAKIFSMKLWIRRWQRSFCRLSELHLFLNCCYKYQLCCLAQTAGQVPFCLSQWFLMCKRAWTLVFSLHLASPYPLGPPLVHLLWPPVGPFPLCKIRILGRAGFLNSVEDSDRKNWLFILRIFICWVWMCCR